MSQQHACVCEQCVKVCISWLKCPFSWCFINTKREDVIAALHTRLEYESLRVIVTKRYMEQKIRLYSKRTAPLLVHWSTQLQMPGTRHVMNLHPHLYTFHHQYVQHNTITCRFMSYRDNTREKEHLWQPSSCRTFITQQLPQLLTILRLHWVLSLTAWDIVSSYIKTAPQYIIGSEIAQVSVVGRSRSRSLAHIHTVIDIYHHCMIARGPPLTLTTSLNETSITECNTHQSLFESCCCSQLSAHIRTCTRTTQTSTPREAHLQLVYALLFQHFSRT